MSSVIEQNHQTNLKQMFKRTTERLACKIAKSIKLRQLCLWWVIENKLSNTRQPKNENNQKSRLLKTQLTLEIYSKPLKASNNEQKNSIQAV